MKASRSAGCSALSTALANREEANQSTESSGANVSERLGGSRGPIKTVLGRFDFLLGRGLAVFLDSNPAIQLLATDLAPPALEATLEREPAPNVVVLGADGSALEGLSK
jgi:hypothetical protein